MQPPDGRFARARGGAAVPVSRAHIQRLRGAEGDRVPALGIQTCSIYITYKFLIKDEWGTRLSALALTSVHDLRSAIRTATRGGVLNHNKPKQSVFLYLYKLAV